MSTRVVITCQQMQDCIDAFRDRLEAHGVELVLPPLRGQQLTEDELLELLSGADGLIAGDDPVTARVLAGAPRLRTIAKWGVGIDGIDTAEARRRGITVTNTPGVFGDDVADVAAGYLVMLARGLHLIHASIVEGAWRKIRGEALTGATLGIAGFGSIGQAVARRGLGFGMRVCAYDVAPAASQLDVELVSCDELFVRSQYLVLCMPLTPDNRHFVDADSLARMPDRSYLVNVARGPLVDQAALVAALESGRIAAAALDVFEVEPLPSDSPLRRFPQCVFGSHNGSNTTQGVFRASERTVANLLQGLQT